MAHERANDDALARAARLQNERDQALVDAIVSADGTRARGLLGAGVTKQYFDECVKDNMDLLGMDRDAAVQETLAQLKLQGIDASQHAAPAKPS